MKKSLVLIFLLVFSTVTALAASSLLTSVTAENISTTTVYFDLPTINGTAIGVGNSVTVNINIHDAVEITGWQAGLIFNSSLLECTGFSQGGFLATSGGTPQWFPGTIDNVGGGITYHAEMLVAPYKASGNGTLGYLTFKVKATGISDLHLRDVKVIKREGYILTEVPIDIIDVYTVVVDTTAHRVVTVSNSTGLTGAYSSGFYNHAFIPDEEISFTVSSPGDTMRPQWKRCFSNVTIPKTLLEPDPTCEWAVIIDGNRLSAAEPIVTENNTHTTIHVTYTLGIHNIHITTRFLASTIMITASSNTVAVGSGVNISGGIDPVRTGVNITIQCRASAWTTIATVPTDLNGNYSYIWTPDTIGTYEFRASWEGDSITLEAVSGGLALDAVLRDLEVSVEAPTYMRIGSPTLLRAIVYNSGTFNETDVELRLLINGTVKASNDTISLLVGESYTLNYNFTSYVEVTYNVTAYAPPKIVSGVGAENDTTNNVATKFVMVRQLWITIEPESGSIGSLVTVEGFYFPNQTRALVTFNDMLIGYAVTDENGSFTFVFSVPVSAHGTHTIKAFYSETNYTYTMFTVIDVTPLDIKIDVGTTHFRGESAEFYIQITHKGAAVNATSINATLYKPDGTTEALTVPPPNATGFYKITYPILGDTLNGTYALVIEASYTTSTIEAYGTSFKTFLLSLTLTDELALIEALIEDLKGKIEHIEDYVLAINLDVMSIKLGVAEITSKIMDVNATLMTVNKTLIDELAQIAAVNATLQSINETISQLETRIDTIKGAQEALTLPLYGTMALALIAAVGTIVTIIFQRRKPRARSLK